MIPIDELIFFRGVAQPPARFIRSSEAYVLHDINYTTIWIGLYAFVLTPTWEEWSWCFFCWGRGTSKYHDRWLKGDDAANLTMRAQMIGTWSSQVLQFRSSKCIRSLWWHLNCRSPSCISPNMPISPKHLNILNLNQVAKNFFLRKKQGATLRMEISSFLSPNVTLCWRFFSRSVGCSRFSTPGFHFDNPTESESNPRVWTVIVCPEPWQRVDVAMATRPGEHRKSCGKSPWLRGKSTATGWCSIAMLNCQRLPCWVLT